MLTTKCQQTGIDDLLLQKTQNVYICDSDLRHAHKTKTTTNKAKPITDYWGGYGIRAHKSKCLRQMGLSLKSGFMLYLHGNAFVC